MQKLHSAGIGITGTLAVMCATLGVANEGFAAPGATFFHEWNMVTGPEFDDFHATYSGTGDSITDLFLNSAQPGEISTLENSSTIDIEWESLVEGVFSYEFNTGSGSATFVSAELTRKVAGGGSTIVGIVTQVTSTHYKITHPTGGQEIGSFNVIFVPGPGPLALVACGLACGRHRRRAA